MKKISTKKTVLNALGSIVFAALLVFSMSACGGNDNTSDGDGSDGSKPEAKATPIERMDFYGSWEFFYNGTNTVITLSYDSFFISYNDTQYAITINTWQEEPCELSNATVRSQVGKTYKLLGTYGIGEDVRWVHLSKDKKKLWWAQQVNSNTTSAYTRQ